MTMTMPGLHRETRKHRVHDKVDELKAEVGRLQTALANVQPAIAQLRQDRRDAVESGDAWRLRVIGAERVASCAMGELEDRTVERDRLAEQNEGLQLRLAPYLAAEANANAITVPAGVRDIDPDEQVTHPIDVREVRERFNAGPVVFSLHNSPLAANPAHIPAWAQTEPAVA